MWVVISNFWGNFPPIPPPPAKYPCIPDDEQLQPRMLPSIGWVLGETSDDVSQGASENGSCSFERQLHDKKRTMPYNIMLNQLHLYTERTGPCRWGNVYITHPKKNCQRGHGFLRQLALFEWWSYIAIFIRKITSFFCYLKRPFLPLKGHTHGRSRGRLMWSYMGLF